MLERLAGATHEVDDALRPRRLARPRARRRRRHAQTVTTRVTFRALSRGRDRRVRRERRRAATRPALRGPGQRGGVRRANRRELHQRRRPAALRSARRAARARVARRPREEGSRLSIRGRNLEPRSTYLPMSGMPPSVNGFEVRERSAPSSGGARGGSFMLTPTSPMPHADRDGLAEAREQVVDRLNGSGMVMPCSGIQAVDRPDRVDLDARVAEADRRRGLRDGDAEDARCLGSFTGRSWLTGRGLACPGAPPHAWRQKPRARVATRRRVKSDSRASVRT